MRFTNPLLTFKSQLKKSTSIRQSQKVVKPNPKVVTSKKVAPQKETIKYFTSNFHLTNQTQSNWLGNQNPQSYGRKSTNIKRI